MINSRYSIIKKVGEGRSSVFVCQDKNFNKIVALKVLPPAAEKEEVIAFKDEFLILKKISHPNIVSVYEYGTILKIEETGSVYSGLLNSKFFTMEYIEGDNLLEYCNKSNNYNIDDLIEQICYVLHYLHESNLVYFDLKFENILVRNSDNKPKITFIDFGFIRNIRKGLVDVKRGTPYYIAPEILLEQNITHQADFYSLGIMLYMLFNGKFPFDVASDIDIYKSHIEKEIIFTDTKIPEKYLPVVAKLCCKEPEKRFSNALQIIEALGIPIDCGLLQRWEPVRSYVINNAIIDLKNFLLMNEPDFVKVIKGASSCGKTSLVEEIAYNFDGVILVTKEDFKSTEAHWKSLLLKILFSEYIYQYIGNFLIYRIIKTIKDEPANLLDELKSIFINLSQRAKFTIIFDDFNRYDPITSQFLLQLIPIGLVNKIRIILVENTDYQCYSGQIPSRTERTLEPFTEEQLNSLLHKTFSDGFPYSIIAKLIYDNCDLYPGPVLTYIKDLIFSKAVQFTANGISIDNLESKTAQIKENQFIFLETRLAGISKKEKCALEFLSLFESEQNYNAIAYACKNELDDVPVILNSLIDKKILFEANNRTFGFNSRALKEYVYNSIEDKVQSHYKTAIQIVNDSGNFSKIEIARQFELGGDFDSAFSLIINYLDAIKKYETYKYECQILEDLKNRPLSSLQCYEIKLRLGEVYFKLGDFKSSYKLTLELIQEEISDSEIGQKLAFRMGKCLVELGSVLEGLSVFKNMLNSIEDKILIKEIEYEIASALTYLSSYEEAETVLINLLKDEYIPNELKANSLNMLGIIEADYKNNPRYSISYFSDALKIYENEKLELKQARATRNIGNVYFMEHNYKDAEVFWRKSLNKNLEIGNLEEEASLLNNYGVLYFKNLDLEKSTENYKLALEIYKSLGQKHGEGMGYANLAETYYFASEYDNAFNALEKAKACFLGIGDFGELCEVMVLKAYLLKSVNDNTGLIRLREEFAELKSNGNLTEKAETHFNLVKILSGTEDLKIKLEKMSKISEVYYSLQDINNYHMVTVILCENMIENRNIPTALEIISSKNFQESITGIPYFLAYERFLLARMSYLQKNDLLKNNLEYLEEGYKILTDCSITELTWRIISYLAEAYMDRGNVNKAVEYIQLTKSLLNHISMNIKDIRIRSLYLATPERKGTLEKLNIWENFIK